MPLPTYLVRSPHGIWYARFVVPTKLRSRYPGLPREWRTSLFCSSRRAAATQARRVWLAWIHVQSLLESAVSDELPVSGYTLIEHSWGRRELHTTPQDTPAQLAQVFAYLERTGASVPAVLRALVERNVAPTVTIFPAAAEASTGGDVDPKTCPALVVAPDAATGTPGDGVDGTAPQRVTEGPSLFLSEVIEKWHQIKATNGTWRSPSNWTYAYGPDLKLCRELLAKEKFQHAGAGDPIWDIRMCDITAADIARMVGDVRRFPKRQGKRTGVDAKEALLLDGAKPEPYNANKKLKRFKSCLKWAASADYADRSLVVALAAQMAGGPSLDPEGGYLPFSADELQSIFQSPSYVHDSFAEAWQYYAPNIALTMGMRVREIADLTVDDVVEVDGSPCIWIRRGKTPSANRKLPVPATLLACGFLDYVAQRRRNGVELLWDNLLWETKSGYGRYISRWFANYLDALGITDDGKVFHSFRSNLHNALVQRGLDPIVIDRVLGHAPKSTRAKHYARNAKGGLAIPVKQVREAIDSYDWGITFHPSKRWGR